MKFSIVRIDKKRVLHLSVKTAEWFFERIKTDTKSEDIGGLRRYIAMYGNGEGYEQRTPVARIYPSVELVKRENGNLQIAAFNGLVWLHVADLLKKEEQVAVKEAVKMLPMTYAAFVGADNRSVEVLVSVTPTDGPMPVAEHEMDVFCRTAYEAALSVYGAILPKPVERQLVTARSHFRMTLDEQPFVSADVHPLKISGLPTAADAKPSDDEPQQWNTDIDLYADYEMMYQQASREAYDETADVIASQQYEAYLTELSRRLCMMGVPEEEAFLHIRNHHVFKHIFDELKLRTIVSAVYAEENPKRQREVLNVSRETRRLVQFLKTRYVFRYNKVMGYTECRPNNTWSYDWGPCDEEMVNGMTLEARLENIDATFNEVRRYTQSSLIRKTDPVVDYFMKVYNVWDGKTDHIGMLARAVPCDFPEWEQWFRKWFLYMVAQWIGRVRDYGNSIVPLLISPQGDGKSTFCRNLLPKELQWGFLDNLVVSEKRQTLQAMHNFLLINLDEFNQISPKLQEGFLKNVIQLPSVKIKRPYGRHVEDFRRMASFIATTNETNVLSDPTGNRRFICVRLTAPIDTDYKPNYDALYSQAYRLVVNRNEQYWFSPDEVQAVIAHNREFELVPPAVYYFKEYYEAVEDERDGEWTTATAIYDRLRKIAGSGLKANGVPRFGRYLKNMPGLRQKRLSMGMTYLVREKK
jgi:hypothetical protein